MLALLLEVDQRQRGAARGDSETVLRQDWRSALGVELFDRDRAATGGQLDEKHADTTDMGERKHDGIPVGFDDAVGVDDA